MNKPARGMLLAALLAPAMIACSAGLYSEPKGQTLVVLAASSLTEVFGQIGEEFRQTYPTVRLIFNFAGSQRLRSQLELGAPGDVFASADWQQMIPLAEQGLLLDEPSSFASNRLALITPNPIETGNDPLVNRLEDLADPEVKLVLAAAAVPAGNYSRRVLELAESQGKMVAGFAEKALSNLVSEEANVRSVAQKVALGEADAGLVYLTDARTEGIGSRVKIIPIPNRFNISTSYPVAVLKEAQQPGLARQFMEFLHSDLAQDILGQHGFGAVESTAGALSLPGVPNLR